MSEAMRKNEGSCSAKERTRRGLGRLQGEANLGVGTQGCVETEGDQK